MYFLLRGLAAEARVRALVLRPPDRPAGEYPDGVAPLEVPHALGAAVRGGAGPREPRDAGGLSRASVPVPAALSRAHPDRHARGAGARHRALVPPRPGRRGIRRASPGWTSRTWTPRSGAASATRRRRSPHASSRGRRRRSSRRSRRPCSARPAALPASRGGTPVALAARSARPRRGRRSQRRGPGALHVSRGGAIRFGPLLRRRSRVGAERRRDPMVPEPGLARSPRGVATTRGSRSWRASGRRISCERPVRTSVLRIRTTRDPTGRAPRWRSCRFSRAAARG